jgi:hypothetical protein
MHMFGTWLMVHFVVQVDVTVAVTMGVIEFVVVTVVESMPIGLHLYFRVAGWGKEMGL